MQFERDQALSQYSCCLQIISGITDGCQGGFRPYIDENGVLYMITLVRQDVVISIKERYEIKVSRSFLFSRCSPTLLLHMPGTRAETIWCSSRTSLLGRRPSRA